MVLGNFLGRCGIYIPTINLFFILFFNLLKKKKKTGTTLRYARFFRSLLVIYQRFLSGDYHPKNIKIKIKRLFKRLFLFYFIFYIFSLRFSCLYFLGLFRKARSKRLSFWELFSTIALVGLEDGALFLHYLLGSVRAAAVHASPASESRRAVKGILDFVL